MEKNEKKKSYNEPNGWRKGKTIVYRRWMIMRRYVLITATFHMANQ